MCLKSLEALFWHLVQKLPLSYILYTPAYEDDNSKHIYISYTGIEMYDNTKIQSKLDMEKIMMHRRRFSQHRVFYINKEEKMDSFFSVINEKIAVTSPCLYFYFMNNGKVLGSIYFGCDSKNEFSQEDIDNMSLLWDPLFFVVKAYVQQNRYEKIISAIQEKNKNLEERIRGFNTDIIGINSGLKNVALEVKRLAPFDISVLILGETGTGKDIFASELHRLSSRSKKNFVAINCGGIAPTLIDSELFGYAKGAFTGAFKDYKGRFERANGGTLFLDEVAELPLESQTRLLRVIQNHMVERLGGNAPIAVDFRLVAATNKNLLEMVKQGRFRNEKVYAIPVIFIIGWRA